MLPPLTPSTTRATGSLRAIRSEHAAHTATLKSTHAESISAMEASHAAREEELLAAATVLREQASRMERVHAAALKVAAEEHMEAVRQRYRWLLLLTNPRPPPWLVA